MQITVKNTPLHLIENQDHEFLISNKEVALGYGTNIQNLSHVKKNNSDELIENKHWIRLEVKTAGGKQKVIHWTKRGIVRLGNFIKSEKARKFRDWAEDYIVNPHANNDEIDSLKQIIMAQNKLIAQQPQIHPKSRLAPVDHNNMLEMVYQFADMNKKNIEFMNQLSVQYQSINNFLQEFKTRYPEASDYVDKCTNYKKKTQLIQYEIKCKFGNFAVIKDENFIVVIDTINAAVDGNKKVLKLINNNETFSDLLGIVELLKSGDDRLSVLCREMINYL